MIDETVEFSVIKIKGNCKSLTNDTIVREVPVTIYFNGEEIATVLCSPSQVREMTVGFLASEGFVRGMGDIYTIGHHCEENSIRVEGRPHPGQAGRMSKRSMSSCCGKSRISFNFENDESLVRVQESTTRISLEEATFYANSLETNSPLFKETGGTHNGGVGCGREVLFSCYDLGRHNVLDKIFGRALMQGLDLSNHVLFFSGRVSSEILLKVAKMNVPILVSRAAPTDMAITLAEELNITVIGFARGDRMNIYSCPERIKIPPLIVREVKAASKRLVPKDLPLTLPGDPDDLAV